MAEIALTEAEQKQALEVALKVKLDAVAAEEAVTRAAAEAKKAEAEAKRRAEEDARNRKKTPGRFVGLWLEGDVIDYRVAEGDEHERRITIDGQNFEHTHEDADGVWMYRRM